jgi:hypothetical protein
MALVRASRKHIASRSIRGRHEWLEECIPCQCHPGRLGHAVLKTLYPAISPFEISNFAGYDLERLAEDSLVVDVGGGVGAQSLTLAQHHPAAPLRYPGSGVRLGRCDRCMYNKSNQTTEVCRTLTRCSGHSTGRGTRPMYSNPIG